MKKLVSMSVAIIFAFLYTACIDSEKVAERAAKKIVETATGEEIEIKKDEKGENKITLKGDDGEEISFSGSDKEMPKDFPDDVYVPKGEVNSSSTISTGDGSMITVNILCEEDVAKLKETIVKEMEAAGWKSASVMDIDGSAIINFAKNGNSATITLGPEGDKTSASYILTIEKKK